MSTETKTEKHSSSVLFMALAALGIVYGDIGTSPIYAIREMFFGQGIVATLTQLDILSRISVVVWTLTLVVSIKYIAFVLRADNEGSGGVFALYGLLHHAKRHYYQIVAIVLTFTAGLLIGDGVITPAISVLSAVEGLSVVAQGLTPYIIPITILILIGLFSVQAFGTAKIGAFFGPVMFVWFVVLAIMAIPFISANPIIFNAINPYYAFEFFNQNDIVTIFKTLGFVVLVVTGGEALYADLGHFGKGPIRFSWFSLTYPALIINYLGQGAFLLSGKPIINGNLFFSLIPETMLVPMVILSTLATVIASQALISGVFSLVMQAVSLGLLPYQYSEHTHEEHEGQIYVPLANWALMIGSIIFVISFKSSNALASAYGLAESGVMIVTTLGIALVARKYWNWSKLTSVLVFTPFFLIDLVLLASNSLKFFDGGFIPVLIALVFAIIFSVWNWGRKQVRLAYEKYPVIHISDVIKLKEKLPPIPKTVILLTSDTVRTWDDPNPVLEQIFIDRYGELPEKIILLKIRRISYPYARKTRYEVSKLYENSKYGSITGVEVNFGYMEEPDVEKVLTGIARHKEVPISEDNRDWLIHVLQPMIHVNPKANFAVQIKFKLFAILQRLSDTPMDYFHLGHDEPLSVDYLPVYLG